MTPDQIESLLNSPITPIVGIVVALSCLWYYYSETKKALKNPTVGSTATFAKNVFWGKPLVLFLILITLVFVAWAVNAVAVGNSGLPI